MFFFDIFRKPGKRIYIFLNLGDFIIRKSRVKKKPPLKKIEFV